MTATSPTPFRELLEALRSPSKDGQNRAFEGLLNATENPVAWAYELWDDLLLTLRDGDNRQRSIAAQVLSNFAKLRSDGNDVLSCMLSENRVAFTVRSSWFEWYLATKKADAHITAAGSPAVRLSRQFDGTSAPQIRLTRQN